MGINMKLDMEGLNEMILGMENLMELPRKVQLDMLNAEADIVVSAQKEEIEKLKLVDSGQLKASIARKSGIELIRSGGMGVCMDIYPQGTRADGVRNAEVGFIHEYGAPKKHIRASGWMKAANEKSVDSAVDAAADVYEQFLQHNF